ncbi:sugar phosphate isomerase/epimerase family protein [Vibrio sp. WXL103]|uniref:sugar phosphate isomerase/epimerase family protein n=1 Tax=Vibrio sp. WXL103 TaxID=3450710 RepID=UPI003EC71DCA
MNEKIQVPEWSINPERLVQLNRIKGIGIETVLIDMGKCSLETYLGNPIALKRYKNVLQDLNLSVGSISMNLINDFNVLSVEERHYFHCCVNAVQQALTACSYLGCKNINVPLFRSSTIRTNQDVVQAIALFNRVCELADINGVQVSFEANLDLDTLLTIREQVGRDNLKYIIDSYNLFLSGICPISLFEGLPIDFISQVHVKDGSGGTEANMNLGQGVGNVSNFIKSVSNSGYSGEWVNETGYYLGVKNVDKDLEFLSSLIS